MFHALKKGLSQASRTVSFYAIFGFLIAMEGALWSSVPFIEGWFHFSTVPLSKLKLPCNRLYAWRIHPKLMFSLAFMALITMSSVSTLLRHAVPPRYFMDSRAIISTAAQSCERPTSHVMRTYKKLQQPVSSRYHPSILITLLISSCTFSSLILVTVAQSFIIELDAAADNLSLQSSKDVGVQNLDSHHIEHRSDNTSAVEYVVWPRDGSNKDANAKIEDLLKQLTQEPQIYSYTDIKGNLMHWLINATDSQVQSIKESDGVARVEQNIFIAEEHA